MEYGEIRCTRCRRIVDDWIDDDAGALCMECADDDRRATRHVMTDDQNRAADLLSTAKRQRFAAHIHRYKIWELSRQNELARAMLTSIEAERQHLAALAAATEES